MRVGVIGLGHVGLTTAACLAHIGHKVVGTDHDLEKLRLIRMGKLPFFEPDLAEMIRNALTSGRLRVSEDMTEVAKDSQIVFICVGTPIRDSGEPILSAVEQVTRAVAPAIEGDAVLVEKSTVPVGTGERIRRTVERIGLGDRLDVASNPEFLREGQAISDTLRPSRIVVGASSSRAHDLLRDLYQPILDETRCPYIATDVATAELIKLASNAFLATKISFANFVADVCDAVGADVETLTAGVGLDPRIGAAFLRAGLGYGGYCLPKDIAAFRHKAEELGVHSGLLAEVAAVNERRVTVVEGKLRDALWNLDGKRVALWGLAFKAGTDDVRESPALKLASRLIAEGTQVIAYDPVVARAATPELPDLEFAADMYEAARDAHAVVIATDWPEFAAVDLARLRDVMAELVIVDGRNVLDPAAVASMGFTYAGIGRPTAPGVAPVPKD